MGKTKMGKGRLDKFYRIAKESGLRSRAAFKLIQINRKYNFLENANILVDLCAAPGGWLQVAEKYMPMNSIKIGVDLDPIKPIPHCKTFIADITTDKCRNLIKKEMNKQKADVVLHDGAPNVGQNWEKDAFTQSELVLASFKLACQILKKGGTFVTKVFRSGDYNSLIWLFQKFFKRVEATKPEASRMVSAEIFVVCQNYLSPDYIDDKFFDVKYVFKDTENDINLQSYYDNEITSVDKVLTKRRHREGYADDVKQHMYKVCTFEHFINCQNPFPVFMEYNKIEFTQADKEKYLSMKIKVPDDYENLMEDIKLLGKREITALVKWRQRVLNENLKQQQKEKKAELQESKNNEEVEQEIDSEEELNKEIEKNDKLALKGLRKERSKKIQLMAKNNGSSSIDQQMNTVSFENNDELFSYTAHRNLDKVGYIDVDEVEAQEKEKIFKKAENKLKKFQFVNENDVEKNVEHLYALRQKKKTVMKEKQQENLLKKKAQKYQDRRGPGVEVDEDSLAIGENAMDEIDEEEMKRQRYDKRYNGGIEVVPNPQAMELEDNQETQQNIQKKLQSKWFDREIFQDLKNDLNKNNKIVKNPIKETFQKGENLQDEEFSDEEDSIDNESEEFRSDVDDGDIDNYDSSDDEGERPSQLSKKSKQIRKTKKDGNLIQSINKQALRAKDKRFNDEADDNSDLEGSDDGVYKKPKKNKKGKSYKNGDDSEEWDDEGAERYVPKAPMSDMERRRKRLARARLRDEKKQEKKNKENEAIQFVEDKDQQDINYDIEDLAANLSLAKKMLRKKDREEIINSSYSRYAMDDGDEENLPSWFIEEEKQHNFLSLPVTKEEVEEEKSRLYAINQKQPKKILEAKNRKKRKLFLQLQKAKKKAEQVYDQEGMKEQTKIRTIHNLMKNARKNAKDNKKYVVGKKGKKGAGKENNRGSKNVDNRMKKEKKAKKRIEKRDGPKMNKRSKPIQKSKAKKVHTNRRRRK